MTQIFQVDSRADDQDQRGGLWLPVVSLWLPSLGNSSAALQQCTGKFPVEMQRIEEVQVQIHLRTQIQMPFL